MSDSFRVSGLAGKQKLRGEISVSGTKNAALQAFAFSILFADELTIKNVPEIEDVRKMAELLSRTGVKVLHSTDGTYNISVPSMIKTSLDGEIFGKLRASIVLSGPVLARFGTVSFTHPGGCVIGARPIDLFIEGFADMGAEFRMKDNKYTFVASKLKGKSMFLRSKSVTVTQTLMFAAVLADGTTIIKNAATEPEIPHMADFLNSCGAKIHGAGTETITIIGGELLYSRGKEYIVLPDRIEAGSFLILSVLAGKEVKIRNCNPNHIEILIKILEHISNSEIIYKKDYILVRNKEKLILRPVHIKTHEYPGFPTDLQAPMSVLLTQADGESLVFETIFEGRLNYVGNIKKMGAHIIEADKHRIYIKGKTALLGRTLGSPDIRAGLAYVIAAAIAKGESLIHNVYVIDRGYEKIEGRLAGLGLEIARVKK